MSSTTITYDEIRFVIEPELTHCYVRMHSGGEWLEGIDGWHHKVFPPSVNAQDILRKWGEGDDPVLWAREAPHV